MGYLKKLRSICSKHDILLIFDEVITGFGRLGTATASDYFGVIPDITVEEESDDFRILSENDNQLKFARKLFTG